MIPLVGIVIVLAAVAGGFLMEGGELGQIAQPAEILIILGAATGAAMVGNSSRHLARTAAALTGTFRRSVYSKEYYLATLAMLYSVFHFARRQDPQALEDAVEPTGSPASGHLFDGYSDGIVKPEIVEFVCDTLRLSALGAVGSFDPGWTFDMDDLMQKDVESRHRFSSVPAELLARVADSLPGFGIIAAVLGVILSMGHMHDEPTVLGYRIATALIGTFTGILLAYGIVSPFAQRLAALEYDESVYFDCIRAGLSAFLKGVPIAIAVESARRAIPEPLRPDFDTAEERCREAIRQHAAPAPPQQVMAAHL